MKKMKKTKKLIIKIKNCYLNNKIIINDEANMSGGYLFFLRNLLKMKTELMT